MKTLLLSIGGEAVRVRAAEPVLAAVGTRMGAFVAGTRSDSLRAPITLEVRERIGQFTPEYERPCQSVCSIDGDEIEFTGFARGRYHVSRREGIVEDVTGLAPVDALLRLALSIALPQGGALLLHGAAIERDAYRAVALCGASGAGKSTAAAVFGAACDELIVLRPGVDGEDVIATPYWRGRPAQVRCDTVVCLERGGVPGLWRHHGSAAVRALARHAVRYVAFESAEHAILAALCRLRAAVVTLRCPEGSAFLPFLGEQLGLAQAPVT